MKTSIKILTSITLILLIAALSIGCVGPTGATGPAGPQGLAGPNSIVALGTVDEQENLHNSYGVTSVTWNTSYGWWEIKLTGIDYFYLDYLTVVTPFDGFANASSVGGKLVIRIYDEAGNHMRTGCNFIVISPPSD